MSKLLIEDVLSWDKFLKETLKEDSYPPKKIKLFNRLMAHSNNFFIISAIGAFSPGYLMLISKKLVPSFSLIDSRGIVDMTLELFGSEKLMWGSDFPPVSNREGYTNALNWLGLKITKQMQLNYRRPLRRNEAGV